MYSLISATFCVIVLLSNILSVKLIPLPFFDLFIPAGLLTYPITFLLSDYVTEMFGAKKARQMVYSALALNVLSYCIVQFVLTLPALDHENEKAFQEILGLSGLRIFSSLAAYLAGQIVDIQLYTLIKRTTGERFLWLRNNGSTWVSQGVDTLVVDLIYLCGGLQLSFALALPVMLFSYAYKAIFSVICTPFLYLLVFLTKKFQWIELPLNRNPNSFSSHEV